MVHRADQIPAESYSYNKNAPPKKRIPPRKTNEILSAIQQAGNRKVTSEHEIFFATIQRFAITIQRTRR
jgi:hypothetical protein